MESQRTYIKKRRVPRRAFERRVGLLARGEYYIANAFELGEGGMLINSQSTLLEGQKVVIVFRIPGMIHVVVRGTVRYSKEKNSELRYGIQFDNLDFNAKRKIRSYVALKSVEEVELLAA